MFALRLMVVLGFGLSSVPVAAVAHPGDGVGDDHTPFHDTTAFCKFGTLPALPESSMLQPKNELTDYRLAVVYVVPADIPYEPEIREGLVTATRDVQAWYQCATGGLDWELEYPELVVKVYFALHDRQYYVDNGNWWGSLLGEMASQGQPIWQTGTVSVLWARGAGWWAGAAQACGGNCGVALLGVELFPELNNPAWSGGDCPPGSGGDAWPCVPLGAMAHELGHTVGLLHPADVPATAPYANHSIMQLHWHYPDLAPPIDRPWGFLTLEREVISANPFMHSGVRLDQIYANCDVVNLPYNGPPPTCDFSLLTEDTTIYTTNTTIGGDLHYWTFDDGGESNYTDPVHTYHWGGNFAVRLRSSSSDSMMDLAEQVVDGSDWVYADRFESGDCSAWCDPGATFCSEVCCQTERYCLPYPTGGDPMGSPVCCDDPCYNDVEQGPFCCGFEIGGETFVCCPGVGCISSSAQCP